MIEDENLAAHVIGDEYVLPCDFVVGHMVFRKGVKLEVVRHAAERWLVLTLALGDSIHDELVRSARLLEAEDRDHD